MADATSNPDELPAESADQPSTEEVKTEPEQSNGTEQAATATETEHSDESADLGGQQTGEQAKTGSGEEEGTFFDPKKVPPELMPAYKQMQGAFVQKTQDLAQRRKELEEQGSTKEEAAEQATVEQQESVVDAVLRAEGIDPAKMTKEERRAFSLVAKIAQASADGTVNKAVAPIYAKETKAEVEGFFKANPDATKHRAKMAEIDRRTSVRQPDGTLKPTLTMDELLALASRDETNSRAKEELSKKAAAKQQNNSEGSASTASGAPAGKDPFKTMLEQSANTPGRF